MQKHNLRLIFICIKTLFLFLYIYQQKLLLSWSIAFFGNNSYHCKIGFELNFNKIGFELNFKEIDFCFNLALIQFEKHFVSDNLNF